MNSLLELLLSDSHHVHLALLALELRMLHKLMDFVKQQQINAYPRCAFSKNMMNLCLSDGIW